MSTPYGTFLASALSLFAVAHLSARAGEVQADPVCRSCAGPAVARYPANPCCDPCPPVGPIRRFFRRIFNPCCPPAPVVVAVPQYRPAPIYVPAPAPVMPRTIAVPAPPATIAPPVVPEPAAPFPSTGSSLRRETYSPPVPVRADRIASAQGEAAPVYRAKSATTPVTIVSVEDATRRVRAEADGAGLVVTVLPRGSWRVFSADAEGNTVAHGRVEVANAGEVRIRLKSGF